MRSGPMSKLARQVPSNAECLTSRKSDERFSRSKRRMFQRCPQPTTTGQLLLEVALFAAENKAFVEQGDRAAAERARKHLVQIRELANQRLAEIPSPQDGFSKGNGLVET